MNAMTMANTDATDYGQGVTPISGEGDDTTSNDNSFSVIDRHSNFDGTFRSSRDLRIEGEVKGTIECQGTLFVAQGANVSATVEAENIAVAGNLNGEIHCLGRLQIMPTGRVRGKVTTITLVINEGAYYEGQLEMAPPDERSSSSTPRPIATRPVATQQTPVSIPSAPPSRPTQSAAPEGGSNPNTFIRRLGGPETPWDKRGDEAEEDGSLRES
jgi:cytoskeletal protein CcmA (bactofilin family)